MNYELRFHPSVEDDLFLAYDWYEQKEFGLGNEFVHLFHSSIEKISRNPLQNAKIYGEFRRYLIPKFPYAIYYQNRINIVLITGVFHTARNPNTLKSKLNNRRN